MNKMMIIDTQENSHTWIDYLRSLETTLSISCSDLTGQSLLSQIQSLRPNLIFADIEWDGSFLSIIPDINQCLPSCRIILYSKEHSFSYVYAALKLHVYDYLIKPFAARELREAVKHAEESFWNVSSAAPSDTDAITARYNFLSQVCANPSYRFNRCDEINTAYHTHFCSGFFRAIFVKLDSFHSPELLEQKHPQLNAKLCGIVLEFFSRSCYDLLIEKRPDGILFFVNYNSHLHNQIEDSLSRLFAEVKAGVAPLCPEINVTLCVGREYTDINSPYNIKNDALDVRWQRMHVGTGQILYWHEYTENALNNNFSALQQRILQACESLDIPLFSKLMDEFFSLPYSMLCSRASRKFIRKIINKLLDMSHVLHHAGYAPVRFRQKLDFLLNTATDFNQFQGTFCRNISELMNEISEVSNILYSPSVTVAMNYVARHYSERLSLQDVARIAQLSTSYFCSLFKRETGRHFSDYLMEYRIGEAKRLLRTETLNISEVAFSCGFTDPRYFSRCFKQRTGTTPSSYQSLSRKDTGL